MKIELVTIGEELLKGITVNTNAAEIGRALFQAGYRLNQHTTLPDEYTPLKSGLEECLKRNEIIISTGGLGPTCDDTTRCVAAEIYDSPLQLNQELLNTLKQRFGEARISLEDQATIPSDATILNNHIGTAPGIVLKNKTTTFMMLPGVPSEMRAMLHEELIPYLKQHFPLKSQNFSQPLYFSELSESAVDPFLRQIQRQHPQVELGIYPSYGILTIYLTVKASSEAEGKSLLEPVVRAVSEQFASHLFSTAENIEKTIQSFFIKNKWTLSLAESCTGGSIAARLTKIPGASEYFLGSLVCYSNALKTSLLQVPEELIQSHGAVSEEVVKAMANGLIKTTGSDFGIAISGIAGPSGGTEEKPVGTIWLAIVKKGEQARAWKIRAFGNRETIIERGVNVCLGKLVDYCDITMK